MLSLLPKTLKVMPNSQPAVKFILFFQPWITDEENKKHIKAQTTEQVKLIETKILS